MDNDFITFLMLLMYLIPILSERGLVDKVIHLVVRSRYQQQELCKILSEEPIIYDGRSKIDNLSVLLSNQSCSPVFCCVNSEKCPDFLIKFVEESFATRHLRSLPIIISSGLFTDPIVRDLHTIPIETVDTRTIKRLDPDCIPDYNCISDIFRVLDRDEAEQSSCLIYYSLMIFREYLKKKGMVEGEASEVIDTLYTNYGTSISSDYFQDCCKEFVVLFRRWRKIYGQIVDITIPIGSDPQDIKNGVFYDGQHLFLSKTTLDSVIAPMLGNTRRRDVLMALSQGGLLIRGNSSDFVYHMRYALNGDRKTASMYRFDLSRIEIGGDQYE